MGPWTIAAVLLAGATLTESGRGILRSTLREAIRAGYLVKDKSLCAIDELKEATSDLIAEVKAEQSDEDTNHTLVKRKSSKASSRKRAEEE